MSTIVGFNAASCDPISEGEALAEVITDVLYENDAWRNQLKVAIARAEDLIAADAPLKCVACGSPKHDDCGQQ